MHGVMQPIDFAVEIAGDGRVADVRVHLTAGRYADAHRLQLPGQVHSFRGNHHPPGRDFAADQLRLQSLALSDKLHFGRRMAGVGLPRGNGKPHSRAGEFGVATAQPIEIAAVFVNRSKTVAIVDEPGG
jgi:hypothetical protein